MPQGGNGGGAAKGVNKILGNWKDDILIGTSGVDVISGRGGNDILQGLGGNDLLDGGDGNDTLTDYLGNNTLIGGAGDDTLSVNGSNNDLLTGGAGADTFSLVAGVPYLSGTVATTTITDFEVGVDRIILPTYFDVLGTAQQVGNDVHILFATGLTLVLQGTDKGDLSASDFEFVASNTIIGTAGNDSLAGTFANDVMYGLAGSDTLSGGGGDDLLYGESPGQFSYVNETLLGGSGNDSLFGGFGDDILDGGDNDDFLSLGTVGMDTATGGAGADRFSFVDGLVYNVAPNINGELDNLTTITDFEPGVDSIEFGVTPFNVIAAAEQQGNDVFILYSGNRGVLLLDTQIGSLAAGDFVFVNPSAIVGTEGADVLVGNDLGQVMQGLGGDDVISALGGADSIDGGIGHDTLFGGNGDDTIVGGDGNDLIIGGTGDDTMTGDAGADVFGIRIPNTAFPSLNTLDNQGTDTITDFEIGTDTIRFGWTPFDVLASAVQDGTDVRIDYATDSTLILQNTSLGALDNSIFVFDSTPVEDPGLL